VLFLGNVPEEVTYSINISAAYCASVQLDVKLEKYESKLAHFKTFKIFPYQQNLIIVKIVCFIFTHRVNDEFTLLLL
jgi:hypothetical protein